MSAHSSKAPTAPHASDARDRSSPDSSGPSASDESRPVAVHVRFAPSQGRRLQRSEPTCCGDGRSLWAERPLLLRRADGTFELIGLSAHLAGLARWILSFGPTAEVRSPARLRRRVAAEARRILQHYDDEKA